MHPLNDKALWPQIEVRPIDAIIVGIDLGKMNDPTAICILHHTCVALDTWTEDTARRRWKQNRREFFDVDYLERLPLGMPYPEQIERIKTVTRQLPKHQLLADNTGAGVPVLDMMDDAGLRPVRIDIGSGKEAQKTSHNKWSVPKTLLIQNIDARLSTKELRISDKLSEAPALIEELENYQAKISSATGYTSFNAREGKHDDLVLALGIALFSAVNRIGVNQVASCSIPDFLAFGAAAAR